jgi:hypothetical protein
LGARPDGGNDGSEKAQQQIATEKIDEVSGEVVSEDQETWQAA